MAITIKDQVIEMTAAADTIPDWVKIAHIRWETPTDPAHIMNLVDGDGNTIAHVNAEAALQDIQVKGPGWVRGVTVQALTSGVVRLYVK